MARHSKAADQPITLFDIFAAVIEYRWRAGFTFLMLLVVSAVAVVLFPKKYESEAKLFVRLGRGSVTMDTAATTGQTIAIQESRESEINSVVDMLESRQLAENVVSKIGAERILKKYSLVEQTMDTLSDMVPEMSSTIIDGEDAMTPEEVDKQKRFELAVKYVVKNTKIKSPKKSTTVTIACRARTANLAKDIAETVIESYNAMHLAAYKSAGSYNFFEENFAEHERMVKEYEDEMREAKNQMTLITIKGKQESLQEQITQVQKDITLANAELFAARASLLDFMADMDRLPEEMPSEKVTGVASTMRDQLYELEIKEKELASKYKPVHPILVKLREQLDTSREILTDQEKERVQNVVASNPVRQDVHKDLLKEKAKVAGFEAKVASLRKIESALHEELREVNLFEVKSSELQRRIDIAGDNHKTYAKKLEQSRISNALDEEAISNVSVVQKPSFQMKHVSPKRSLLAALGVLFSMFGAVFVAVASDRYPGVDDDYAELDNRLTEIEELAAERKALEERAAELRAMEEKERLADKVVEEVKDALVDEPDNPQSPR